MNRAPIGAAREYRGFLVQRDGGACAPWRAWHPDGIKVRADTLAGLKRQIADAVA